MDNNDKSSKKKVTDDYVSGLGGTEDSFTKSRMPGPVQRPAKLPERPKKEEPKQVVKPVESPKIQEKKPEIPKVVVPSFIKKDSQLEKDIVKVIQEVPRDELEKILKPTKEAKEKLLKMDFQNRPDMSEEEKRDFIEQISKREPEPQIAEMNGALVWKWQKNRRSQGKNDVK